MNLQGLRERVRTLSGVRLDSIRSDADINQVVNETYQEILGLFAWPFLRAEVSVSVPAQSAQFLTPTVFRYISAVVGERRLSQTTLDEMDLLLDEEGEPRLYARVDDRAIRLWPTPKDAVTLTIRGQVEFEPLETEQDEPVFAEQFHPVVAYRAAARVLAEEGDDSGRSESYQLDAGSYLQRMQDYYMKTNDISLIRIGSRRRRH
jgi:hypothetical protein